MWWRNYSQTIFQKIRIDYISGSTVECFIQFVFVAYQVDDYRNILKLSCRALAFTSYKYFLKSKRISGTSLHTWLSAEKYLSCSILLTDWISLAGCLYFLKCWAICVLQLFVNQTVTSWIMELTLSF